MNSNIRAVRDIFHFAAELIASGEQTFCCLAIKAAAKRLLACPWYLQIQALDHFEDCFDPYWDGSVRRIPNSATFWNKESTPLRQEQRYMALLSAAESYSY
jgi:hypothetical protein